MRSLSGGSGPSLTDVLAAFQLAPHQIQTFDPAHPRFDAQRPLLVFAPQFQAARPYLAARYPAPSEAQALVNGAPISAPIDALPTHAAAWLLPALPPEHDLRGIAGLQGITEHLFGPDGCPWDKAQTAQTLATYFLEEAYELVDAIEGGDPAAIREELGDILFHVFTQTSVAQQAGHFTADDVVEYIARKLVRRHPHVYGDIDTDSPDEIERIWEQIKAQERAERDARDPHASRPESALDSVPTSAPALLRSSQLIGRAARAGLGPPPRSARDQLALTLETLGASPIETPVEEAQIEEAQIEEAQIEEAQIGETQIDEAQIGALLWTIVSLARDSDVDAEQALRLTAGAFIERFRTVENEARADARPLSELPSERRRAAWPHPTYGARPTTDTAQ